MGVLRKIRCRLVRVEKDVKDIREDLKKPGKEEEAEKEQAIARLRRLENQLHRS